MSGAAQDWAEVGHSGHLGKDAQQDLAELFGDR